VSEAPSITAVGLIAVRVGPGLRTEKLRLAVLCPPYDWTAGFVTVTVRGPAVVRKALGMVAVSWVPDIQLAVTGVPLTLTVVTMLEV